MDERKVVGGWRAGDGMRRQLYGKSEKAVNSPYPSSCVRLQRGQVLSHWFLQFYSKGLWGHVLRDGPLVIRAFFMKYSHTWGSHECNPSTNPKKETRVKPITPQDIEEVKYNRTRLASKASFLHFKNRKCKKYRRIQNILLNICVITPRMNKYWYFVFYVPVFKTHHRHSQVYLFKPSWVHLPLHPQREQLL